MTKTVSRETNKKKGHPRVKRKYKQVEKYETEADILAELERIEAEEYKLDQIEMDYISTHRWEYFKPFGWQERCNDAIRKKLIVIAPAPNKIGKTTKVAVILCSWLKGYEAWNEVDVDYPKAVKVGQKFYKPSSLEIAPPVKIRLTGEDWNHHLGQVVVPELKKWFPMEEFTTKKNTNGVEYFWVHKNGSTLELLTHGMEDDLYESWFGHGWIPDEPPPQKKFTAMARGLFGNRGKILIPTTPLKESWILDELILSNRSDVAVMDDLCCLDNEIFYLHDDKVLTEMGLSGKETKHWKDAEGLKKEFFDKLLYIDDRGVEAEKFLRENCRYEAKLDMVQELYFLKFAKDTSLDEKPSRFFGTFKKLVGLVVKEFDRSVHIVEDDGKGIPTNWIVTVFIDFHLGKPQAIAFYACSERNIHYVIDEVWENMPPEDIADLIIRKKRVNCWNISEVFIDPLSKGDEKYMKNRFEDIDDAFTVIEERLEAEDITLEVASKDKKSGFTNIKSWLEGPNKIPILYFLDSLQSVKDNKYGHVHEIQRLCYDDNGMIEKVDDHFMECLYRYTLAGIEYEDNRKRNLKALVGANSYKGGWMA